MQPNKRRRTYNTARADKRTHVTPNHRCWICDHWDEIAASDGRRWQWARGLPFFGCSYKKRLARQSAHPEE